MAMEIDRNAEEVNGTVKLLSSDGKVFEVAKAVALQSVIISKVMEDFGTQNPIPLLEVSSDILEKVIEYCAYHVDHTTDYIDTWDAAFIDVDDITLSEIAMATHFLDIKSLTRLVCHKFADTIQSYQTPERVREMLHIPNDRPQEPERRRGSGWDPDEPEHSPEDLWYL